MKLLKVKRKFYKASNLPILDSHGFPVTYPDRYKVTLTFKGGTLVQNVSEAMYNDLELNGTYMFKGSLGFVKDFGQDVLSPGFGNLGSVLSSQEGLYPLFLFLETLKKSFKKAKKTLFPQWFIKGGLVRQI